MVCCGTKIILIAIALRRLFEEVASWDFCTIALIRAQTMRKPLWSFRGDDVTNRSSFSCSKQTSLMQISWGYFIYCTLFIALGAIILFLEHWGLRQSSWRCTDGNMLVVILRSNRLLGGTCQSKVVSDEARLAAPEVPTATRWSLSKASCHRGANGHLLVIEQGKLA